MRELSIPQPVGDALSNGAALAISISGGKDSQALLAAVCAAYHKHGWIGPIFAIHAHLGRMEWPQSLGHCHALADAAGVPLVVVERPQGDLLQRMRDRMKQLEGSGRPFWPSASARYCTSDLKRGQINKALRQFDLIISAEGIRADESKARACKPTHEVRNAIQTLSRDAWTWNAIIDWSLDDVWEACGTSRQDLERRRVLYHQGDERNALAGWPAHPAYVYGNERVSCALCVLASINDLRVGARHNPELHQTLVQMEQESGFTFKHNFSLADLGDAAPADAVQLPLI